MTQERLPYVELTPVVEIPKSLDVFDGNLEAGVSWSFNDAVIDVQRAMGPEFYLTQSSFAEIMPSNWDRKSAGQALADFDRYFERFVLDKMGYSQEEIDLITTEPEDGQTEDEPLDSQNKVEEMPVDAGQAQFDRDFMGIVMHYGDEVAITIPEEGSLDNVPNTKLVGAVALVNTLAEAETSAAETSPIEMDQERAANLDAFSKVIAEHPELRMLGDDFAADLEEYLQHKYTPAVNV